MHCHLGSSFKEIGVRKQDVDKMLTANQSDHKGLKWVWVNNPSHLFQFQSTTFEKKSSQTLKLLEQWAAA